jgi:AraC-like DNA-binding protein
MVDILSTSHQAGGSSRLWIRRLGVDQTTPPCLISRCRQEWFLSWFHGPAVVTDRLGTQQAIAGDVICYAPGEQQRFGNREAPWRNSFLAISGPLAATWLDGFPCGRLLRLEDQDAPRWTLLALHHELSRFQHPNPGIIANLVENLLAALIRHAGRSQLKSLPIELSQAWLVMSKEFADSNFSITGLARRVGLSPSALTRAFKKNFSCSPAEALQRLRLDRAQELLADDATIAEAASASGYLDHRYFSRVVRHRLGCTPSELRRKLRRQIQEIPPERSAELS